MNQFQVWFVYQIVQYDTTWIEVWPSFKYIDHRGTEDVKTAVLFNHMKKVKVKKACHIMSNIDCLSICPSQVRMFHANIMWSHLVVWSIMAEIPLLFWLVGCGLVVSSTVAEECWPHTVECVVLMWCGLVVSSTVAEECWPHTDTVECVVLMWCGLVVSSAGAEECWLHTVVCVLLIRCGLVVSSTLPEICGPH